PVLLGVAPVVPGHDLEPFVARRDFLDRSSQGREGVGRSANSIRSADLVSAPARENGAVPVGAVEVESHTGGNLVSGEVVHTDTDTGRDDVLVQYPASRRVVDDQVLVVGRYREENSVTRFGAFGHRYGQRRMVTGGNLTAVQTLFDRVHG